MVIVAHNTSENASSRRPPRLLGVFAHPDDETLCAGGTFAKYASAGAEVRVVSLTKGGAGQIRDASAATRSTLRAVREKELDAAGNELGLTETRCLDYPDGGLSEIDSEVLVGVASELLSEIDPDVVITFGPDGFSGHPDHIAVGAAVTAACYEMRSSTSIRLFHCHLPRSRMLLRDRLAEWVVELTTRFKGTRTSSVRCRSSRARRRRSDMRPTSSMSSGFHPAHTSSSRARPRRRCTSSCPVTWRSGERATTVGCEWSTGRGRGSSSEKRASPRANPATRMWLRWMTSPA